MSFSFRPAIRESVSLVVGPIGPSGGGKTYTAMRMATGIVGKGNPFAVIDTEAGRSRHYADMFKFDVGDLLPPFRPDVYAEAIKTADKAGYKAIIVDSFSHEWAGEGGILDWQEEELTRMAGDDYKRREACKMAAWIKPKLAHKQMVQKLLQVRATLILCFRAEEKIKMEKDQAGKIQIVPIGWQPICSKELPYELTVSFLLLPDRPGIPRPIKLQEQHKALFPLDRCIDEEAGRRIAEWAAGGAKKEVRVEPTELDAGLPTPEEEVKALEERGMTGDSEMSGYKSDIEGFTVGGDLMKWFSALKKGGRLTPEKTSEVAKWVNDRLAALSKKGAKG